MLLCEGAWPTSVLPVGAGDCQGDGGRPIAPTLAHHTGGYSAQSSPTAGWSFTKLTEGPLEKGSPTHQVDRFLGRRLETEWEVLELEDYHRRDRTVKSPIDLEVGYDLDPVGDGTRFSLTMIAETGAGGFFGKLADTVVTRIAKRDWQANLENLKDLLEAETP